MITYLLLAALVVACAILDRLRGDERGFNRSLEKLVYGMALATIVALQAPTIPFGAFAALAIAVAFGASPGWGEIYGAFLRSEPMRKEKIKWWQVGIFATNVYAAMALRGLIWAAPVLAVALYTGFGYSIVLGTAVSFPVALILAKKLYVPKDYVETLERNDLKTAWQRSELIRGALSGTLSIIKI